MAPTRAKRPAKGQSIEVNQGPDQWTGLRAEFAGWLIDGERAHYRGEQQDWARAHGVTEETLSRWRRHPEVLGITSTWRERLNADFGRATARMMSLALYGPPTVAVAAYEKVAKAMGMNAPDRHEITGKMTLADFLAAGGYSREDHPAEEQRVRVN